MSEIVPACLWRVNGALVIALDETFGDPDDCYVNGAQVWLRDDGPGGATLEWRLHPVAGFVRPPGIETHELLETVVFALRRDVDLPAPLDRLWDGLEAFPGFADDPEPAPLAAACTAALGIEPDVYGLVDHTTVGDRWERSNGSISIVDALFAQLAR